MKNKYKSPISHREQLALCRFLCNIWYLYQILKHALTKIIERILITKGTLVSGEQYVFDMFFWLSNFYTLLGNKNRIESFILEIK